MKDTIKTFHSLKNGAGRGSIPSTCGSPLQSFNELYIVRWNIDRERVCVI